MSDQPDDSLRRLAELRQVTRRAAVEFVQQHGDQVEAHRAQISAGVQEVIERLRHDVDRLTTGNAVCRQLVDQAGEYINWLQWSFWDLPYFAVAIRPAADTFRRAVSSCGLVYLSIRIFDDVIDRHFWYKGKHPTLLSATSQTAAAGQSTEGLTLLAGLLLCFEGLASLSDSAQRDLAGMLQPVIEAVRRAVIGAIMEYSDPADWTPAYYDRLVQLKNVDYWRCLYTAIDPQRRSPLYPFLERYYTLAQHLNDVEDFAEDAQRGQPNLLSLYLPRHDGPAACRPRDDRPVAPAPADVVRLLADEFLDLGRRADSLPPLEQLVAQHKLGESLEHAYRLGLFPLAVDEAEPDGQPVPSRLGLHWLAHLHEVVARAGSESLEQVDCAVCGGRDRTYLFRKQGFAYHRCRACSHIYVSPRITAAIQARIGQELDDEEDDRYLEVQKIYALTICHLLRARAPGNRLLDLGFGRGYLMQLARAYGFEVYGVDSSGTQLDQLWPYFGKHLAQRVLGQAALPWSSFDVVVMSHILEHLPDPASSLQQVREVLNPGGILYLAVPDLRSMAFQVFGKKWDVVNPLVHLQYFDEDSLSHLLHAGGFRDLERVQLPPIADEVVPRWLGLMRKLGGSDSNELAILAQLPRGA